MATTLQRTQSATRRSTGRLTLPLRPYVLGAVFKRNFLSYFINPAGYVFITLFVFVSSWAAFWQPVFFANNLANLAPLNEWMPYLLLFFIPAITMSTWAEERRQGTDELLLTLPARDGEVVLGKYLAALGIYTVALLFLTLSHVAILLWLGSPDVGVLSATFLGYWLMGAMLIAIGMVASLLSSNVTVAFILGAVFTAIPVFVGHLGSTAGSRARLLIEDLSVPSQFHDFGTGVVPLAGVFYFVSLAAGMLFLNILLLGRRHWAGGEQSGERWGHALIRTCAVAVALISLNVLASRAAARLDLSSEHLHTLTSQTRALIKQIPADRPVLIQAYYSREVPREYVETKANLLGLLREYAALGGDRIRLNLIETERYSEAARDADRRFGIKSRQVLTSDEARQAAPEIYLGVAFTSGLEEVVVPFFDRGLPVEYELTRSIRVVSRTQRKKVGILSTDARLLGGFDFHSMGQSPEWSIVTELKKQYEVSSVAADSEIPGDFDVLLVAQPSSLGQKQIDNLTAYVRKGRPTLLFLDPLPAVDPQLSPELPKAPPGGPFGGGPPPEPKGNLQPLLDLLGLEWPNNEIVWNPYNPHPKLGDLPPEVVFVGKGRRGNAFNPDDIITSGLQDMVLLFPGLLRAKRSSDLTFTPLLGTNTDGGTVLWSETVERGFMGLSGFNANRPHILTGESYTLAARISGKLPAAAEPDAKSGKGKKAAEPPAEVHAIAIADLDVISETFFNLRRRGDENFDFDNVSFVLNCVDVLAGDDAFVGLRKRRLRHRTLERIEAQTEAFVKQSLAESKAAEDAAKEQLKKAQRQLDEKVEALRKRTDMDERTKEIMLTNLQDVENRRLEVKKVNIEDEKRQKIEESKAETAQAVRQIENGVRARAIIIPPLPALALGLVVFGVRLRRENKGASPHRLA